MSEAQKVMDILQKNPPKPPETVSDQQVGDAIVTLINWIIPQFFLENEYGIAHRYDLNKNGEVDTDTKANQVCQCLKKHLLDQGVVFKGDEDGERDESP